MFETDLAAYLTRQTGYEVRRVVQDGRRDRGDLEGLPGFCIQAKNTGRITLPSWMDDLRRQTRESLEPHGALIMSRRGALIGDAMVAMTLRDFVGLPRLWHP